MEVLRERKAEIGKCQRTRLSPARSNMCASNVHVSWTHARSGKMAVILSFEGGNVKIHLEIALFFVNVIYV